MCKNGKNDGKLVEEIKIMSLEGSWLSKENKKIIFNSTADKKYTDKNGNEVIIKANKDKLYTATIPYSLETIRAFNKVPKEFIEENEEVFTKLFVNFKFTKDMFVDDIDDNKAKKISKKKLRKMIYAKNVYIDDIEYCFFKRGASKARTANVLFIKKEYKDLIYNPCLLGLKFEENEEYDITSREAYTSLIMSGIIGTIDIKSDEILIIDDLESPSFKAKQSLTIKDFDGTIKQIEDDFDVINNMTDGQGLLDEGVYVKNKLINENTCVLLRNDFLKCNACRTRLQEYWKENNIIKVWDMCRGWIDSNKIKLVITPSSCKYLKFADQFESKKECFMDWLNRIPSTFGVVKTDHVGNYGYSNRLSYQMLNSMNVSYEEVKELMQDELDYIKLLKDNTLVDSKELRKMSKKHKAENRKLRNEMGYFLDLVQDKNVENTTGDMIADLLNRNSDFRFTNKFKDWKNKQLQDYISELRLGKIRIKNSIYAIMISCPYEMLVATTKEDNKVDKCIMDGWECYCPRFTEGKELLGIRNPQINAGNIAHLTNKYHVEYKWFGNMENGQATHDFVVFVNTYNVDLMNRLQGCDFDVDTVFLTDNNLLVQKAKESQVWATPTNGIKGTKELSKNNLLELADLDNYLGGSTMSIGKIVNKSAIFNAYMYNAVNNGANDNYVKKCYEASSTLSSFSQIAIDMAKKSFKGLSLTKEMNLLNNKTYINNEGQEEQILNFKFDVDEVEITLLELIKDTLKDKDKRQYILSDNIEINVKELQKEYQELKEELKEGVIKEFPSKFSDKVTVLTNKMIVPFFFTYIAKDNSYRIPTKMDCGMDYLEDVIDNIDTKAMQVNKVEIKDLFVLQKELDGKAFNTTKIDKAREIIDNCQSVLDKNCYVAIDDEETKRQKNNIRNWVKRNSIKQLKELELNEKTVHRILLRAFNLDANYKKHILFKKDKNGNIITYMDWDLEEEFDITIKELKEMTLLTLTLIYNSYSETFVKCFIEKIDDKKEIERFW